MIEISISMLDKVWDMGRCGMESAWLWCTVCTPIHQKTG